MATKVDKAYRDLRRGIVTGAIVADRPYEEGELVEFARTGRTPVREALKRLVEDRFLIWPTRGMLLVQSPTMEGLQRLYEARMLMEPAAAKLAATRVTPEQMKLIETCGVRLRQMMAKDDVYEGVEADHALHTAISAGSNNPYLTEAIRRLNCGSLRIWYLAQLNHGMRDSHQALIEAVRSRQPDRAEKTVRDHILSSFERQRELSFASLRTVQDMPASPAISLSEGS